MYVIVVGSTDCIILQFDAIYPFQFKIAVNYILVKDSPIHCNIAWCVHNASNVCLKRSAIL
jgi:hypothetical protein